MFGSMSGRTRVALAFIFIGLVFALMPDRWIETAFGFSPDNGDDSLEMLISAIPILLGILGMADIVMRNRAAIRNVLVRTRA
ncbi:MAG: hypothetical protein WCF81_08820 [Roseiarcus sp.]